MVFLRDKWYLRQISNTEKSTSRSKNREVIFCVILSRAPFSTFNKYIHDDEATLGH